MIDETHDQQPNNHRDPTTTIAALQQHIATLEDTLSHYQAFVEGSSDIMVQTDSEGTIIYANPSAKRLLCGQQQDCVGKSILTYIYGQDRESTRQSLAEWHKSHPTTHSFENRLVSVSGETRIFWWTVRFTYADDDTMTGIYGIGRDITDLHATEQQLRIFQQLVEQAPEGIRISTPDGTITYANRAYREQVEGGEAMIGHHFSETYYEDPEVGQQRWNEMLEHGSWYGVLTLNGPNNTTFQGNVSAYIVYDKHQQPLAVVSSFRNVTELLQTQDALRASEERYRRIVELAGDGIWIIDAESNTSFVNKRMADMLGYTEEELVGEPIFAFFDDEWAVLAARFMQADPATDLPNRFDCKLIAKDGSHLWGLVTGRAYTGPDGALEFLLMVTNITDRKHLEQDLAQNQKLLSAFLEHSPSAIFLKDCEGRVLLANQGVGDMVNMRAEEMIGKTVYDLLPFEFADPIWKSEYQAIEKNKPLQVEEETLVNGEVHTVYSVKFPVTDEDGAPYGVGGILTDITEHRRLEQERANLQEQIIEGQRNALRELSSPLIPIADKVVIMPLIGSIDSTRAQQVMEALLEGVARYDAEVSIIDVTGIPIVDTQVANALIRAARAVKILGSEVVMTGISPTMAQTIVSLGVSFNELRTLSTLQRGVAYALSITSEDEDVDWGDQ
jgi:rsbT co-antagonist protein RsbR